MKRMRIILLLLVASAVLSSVALGRPGGRHGHGRGHDPAGFVAHHAEVLGLDEATLESIQAVVSASREESEALRDQLRETHRSIHESLGAEEPDESALMALAETAGDLETQLHQLRLRSMLQIRALLTPEQRAELQRIRDEGPFARFRAAREACAAEVAQHCPDAPSHGPHALFCLKGRDEAQLSDACSQAMQELPSRHHRRHGHDRDEPEER